MNKLVSWVEIPANDIDRAVVFYNTLLNLELTVTDCGGEKMACFPTGEGAVFSAPGFSPSQQGTLVSFRVKKGIEGVLSQIEEKGGRIIRQKSRIEAENKGYFALILDSEGNRIGLHEQ